MEERAVGEEGVKVVKGIRIQDKGTKTAAGGRRSTIAGVVVVEIELETSSINQGDILFTLPFSTCLIWK
jgi:hypothetical protein